MKVHIYQNLPKVSTYYHEGGGCVIVSNEPQEAWKTHYLNLAKGDKYSAEEYTSLANEQLPEPDLVLDAESDEEKVFIFEDAGCC